MKKITIEIDERYGRVLTISATGTDSLGGVYVTTCAADITKHNHIAIDYYGKAAIDCEATDDGQA